VYFGHDAIWHIPPDQKVDANTATRAGFRIAVAKPEFESALIYKLQRKKPHEFNDQSNVDSTFTEDASTSLQLLVILGSNDHYDFSARVLLIKHSNTIVWDEDKLKKLHSMHLALLKSDYNIKDTWLLDNTTVLMTTSNWNESKRTIEITISEGTNEDDSMEPLWVSSSM
jgi:hypothetical protein